MQRVEEQSISEIRFASSGGKGNWEVFIVEKIFQLHFGGQNGVY